MSLGSLSSEKQRIQPTTAGAGGTQIRKSRNDAVSRGALILPIESLCSFFLGNYNSACFGNNTKCSSELALAGTCPECLRLL